MNDGAPKVLTLNRAEAGATLETLKATEMIVEILFGFSPKLVLSILMNVCAMVICTFASSETEAIEAAKSFRKELERTIRFNWAAFKANREQRNG